MIPTTLLEEWKILYQQGQSCLTISIQYNGYNQDYVHRALTNAGTAMRARGGKKSTFTPTDMIKLEKLIAEGLPWTIISQRMGRGYDACRKAWKKHQANKEAT